MSNFELGYYTNSGFHNPYLYSGELKNLFLTKHPLPQAGTKTPIQFPNSDNDNGKPINEKRLSTGAKIGIGTGILTSLAVAGDIVCCKGKHIKQLTSGIDDIIKANKKTNAKLVKFDKPIITTLKEVDLKPTNLTPKALDATKIDEDSLVLVHMTRYMPKNGKILSPKDAIIKNGLGTNRNSVHFSLNAPVAAHRGGDWDNFNIAVISPYKSAKQANSAGKFIEGMPEDLYTNGSVNIPQGSVIIKHNPDIEIGKIKLSEMSDAPGIKLIETADKPHAISPEIIKKMGFTHATSNNGMGVFDMGVTRVKSQYPEAIANNLEAWKDFCRTQNIIPMKHHGGTNTRAEKVIEKIDFIAKGDSWSPHNFDFKSKIINELDDIQKYVDKGHFTSMDIPAFKKIIETSDTPATALERLKSEIKITPYETYKYYDITKPNECQQVYDSLYDIPWLKKNIEMYTEPGIDMNRLKKDHLCFDLLFMK